MVHNPCRVVMTAGCIGSMAAASTTTLVDGGGCLRFCCSDELLFVVLDVAIVD